MGPQIKMTIFAFSNQGMSMPSGLYIMQINPASLKFTKGIQNTKDETLGQQYQSGKYSNHKETTLSFDTILDATGVVSKIVLPIDVQILALENTIYDINGSIHRPNYLKIIWGTTIFKGTLRSLNYDYTLFSSIGIPLRVKVSLSFVGFLDSILSAQLINLTSPDLSHHITLKTGETIASLCNQIYGDPTYCLEIAKYNKLSSFKNIKPGTELMFPPLNRNGKITE